MSLKLKLLALTGMSLALVFTSACMGGKKEEQKKQAKEMCNQAARICKDGSKAVKEGETGCYQKCPEDTTILTEVSTSTVTQTQVNTVTQTQTNTN